VCKLQYSIDKAIMIPVMKRTIGSFMYTMVILPVG
jgi:hypothetical protein